MIDTIKLTLAGTALLAAGSAGFGLAHTLAAADIAQLNEAHTQALNTALAAQLAAETRAQALETAGRTATTEAVTKYDEGRKNDKAKDDRTIADLRADVKRLRVSTTSHPSGGALPAAGPAAGAGDGQAQQTLSGSVAARLAGRYADYNELVDQLELCQGQLERDRSITAPGAE